MSLPEKTVIEPASLKLTSIGRMVLDIRTGRWTSTPSQSQEVSTSVENSEEEEEATDTAYHISQNTQKRTTLDREVLEKLRPVKGFPHSWNVESAPAIRLLLPKDAFVGREWKASVEIESGELPGQLSAFVTAEDGTSIPVLVEG